MHAHTQTDGWEQAKVHACRHSDMQANAGTPRRTHKTPRIVFMRTHARNRARARAHTRRRCIQADLGSCSLELCEENTVKITAAKHEAAEERQQPSKRGEHDTIVFSAR